MATDDQRPSRDPLLPQVAAGERAAMAECIVRYGSLVWSIARRFEPSDAEDAVQEVFVDLWKSASRFDATIASESAFVAMICRRRLIDRRRARLRRPQTETIADAPSFRDPGSRPDICVEASQAAHALDQLRPAQREVLLLSAVGGFSHGEISERTGMPLGTVKAHARRGLISIRATLLGVDEEDPS
jgi:RNA polymerase sigma-70 factor, ECF subfamily